MRRRIFMLSALSGLGLFSWAAAAENEKPAEPAKEAAKQPAAKPAEKPKSAETPQKPPLSQEMTALRDAMRRVLTQYFHQPINTGDNTPADVMAFCLAYGADGEIRYGNSAGTAMNGIGCLCWNYPCAGYQLLLADGNQIIARVGYGFQEQPSELLAILAQATVPASYEVRVGQVRATVADLVRYEQLDCREGMVLAGKLIGMSHYVSNGDTWKNRLGETWSVERLLQEELGRSSKNDRSDATDRLMAISYALDRQKRLKKPIEGPYAAAQKHLDEYIEYALKLQNPEGPWHPLFFVARGGSNDWVGSVRATGHILEWLVFTLSDDRLQDPRTVKAATWLVNALDQYGNQWNAAQSSSRETNAIGHALHALRLYDRRVFKPYDRNQPEAEKETPAPAGEVRP